MAKSRIVAGLELGSSKIATIVAQVTTDQATLNNKISIVGVSSVASKGVKKGQIVNIEESVEAIIASVEGAERMAGYNLDSAIVAVGGASISSQNSHGVVAVSRPEEEIGAEDVDRVIEAASAISLPSSKEIVHVIPREFSVDGEHGVKDPIGMSGVRLEVDTHLITASAASLKNLRKAVGEVGVNIEDIVFSGIAASEAVLSDTEKELGCVLIDIGGGTTSFVVYVDGSVSYSGVIPIGAKNVTNDLAIGLRVSLDSAETIKLALTEESKQPEKNATRADKMDLTKLGIKEVKNVSRKTLTEGIIRPRLNEIFTMVRLDLEKHNLATRIPSGAIITGGGAETIGVENSAKRMLSLPVRVGEPVGISGLIDDVVNPSFAVPAGLILYGSNFETTEPLSGIGKKFKLPTKGLFSKYVEKAKDLLP
jgi:cell division protein FtsA